MSMIIHNWGQKAKPCHNWPDNITTQWWLYFNLKLSASDSKSKRVSKLPASFSGFIVTERIPSESGSLTQPVVPVDCLDECQEYRRIYYEVIDKMHQEMCRRFAESTSAIMIGIEACDPCKENFMNVDLMQPSSELFHKPGRVACPGC